MLKNWFLFFSLLSWSSQTMAEINTSQALAVGQGISSPSVTSLINFSRGFTRENPTGALNSKGFRLSGHYNQNGSTSYGGEASFAAESWGLAAGYLDCEDCDDGQAAGALGLSVGFLSFGAGFAEDLYSAGLMLGSNESLQFGLMAEFGEISNADVVSYGVGVAMSFNSWKLVIDASKRDSDEDSSTNDELVLLTPGVLVFVDIIQVSVSYQARLNDNTDTDGTLYGGIGVNFDPIHIAVYADYINDVAASLTYFF